MQTSKIFLIVSLIASHGLRASDVQKQLDAPTNTVVVHITIADILKTCSCIGVSKEACTQAYLQACVNTMPVKERRDEFIANSPNCSANGFKCTTKFLCHDCANQAEMLTKLNRAVKKSEAIEEKLKNELDTYKN